MNSPFARMCRLSSLVVMVLLTAAVTSTVWSATDTAQIPPSVTVWGTRGLTQVASAEALGAGRMTFCLLGTWYHQKNTIVDAPPPDANIGTGTFAFSFAASQNIELFATVSGYGISDYGPDHGKGLGSIGGGLQGTLPLPKRLPLRLGAQAAIVGGTSQNQINPNFADGYNYFETRTGYDITGRAIEALVLGGDYLGFKLMLNEAFVTSVQKSKSNLMVLSGGIQGILARYLMLGLELNSRTYLDDVHVRTSPLWLTPSLGARTPAGLAFSAGCDISLSTDRAGGVPSPALEPFRLFGQLTLSIDVLARKRKAAAAKEQQRIAEKAALEARADSLKAQTDTLTVKAEKAREDSVLQARQTDSLAQVAQKLAEKARLDSVALAESQRRLSEERSKRSDMEKQLLSTGMLVLDAVYFETGKVDISMNSKPYLTIIAKMLVKYPKLKLKVCGHTDDRGKPESNLRLSQSRAESVRAFMTNVEPDLADRLSAMGYGSSMPKADNNTADGRKSNRRTELVVTNREVLQEYNP